MHRTPRNYQTSGIDWLTQPNVKLNPNDLFPTLCRHMLTDAPGAGKSFQASEAANILTRNQTHSITIIAPAHLCKQWFEFIGEQYPDDTLIWFEGPSNKKARDAKLHARWYIISTQSFRHKHFVDLYTRLFISNHVDCVILDESHYCKNKDAKTSHYIREITRPQFISHVIELTATPIMREADDLYMQLRILDPLTFHRHDLFLNTYCWFSWTSWGAQDISLRKGAVEALHPWMMGRSYKEIGLELPPIISTIHTSPMIPQRRKAYDNIKTYWWTLVNEDTVQHDKEGNPVLTANSAMQVMHMLRHIISAPEKQSDLASYLADDPGPYLIATFYRDSTKELAAYIAQHHPDYNPIIITGEIPADERMQKAKASHNPKDIIIATIPSISEGVDLSHCNTVYFYEEDYTPGKMYQFLSRVRRHRDGDTAVTITEDNHLHIEANPNDKPVLVRYFHAEKSMDTHIHEVQSRRAVNVRDLVKVELGA